MSALTAPRCSTLLFAVVVVFVSADQKIILAVPGQDVTLPCQARNNNVTVLNWTRSDLKTENVLLYQDGHSDSTHQHPSFKNRTDLRDKQMKDGDVSLILKDVTINDAGTYECRVFMNETGSWKNISFVYLVVPPEPTIITAESGQDITLTCRAPTKKIRGVVWSRADKPGFVLLYQDGRFVTDDKHPSFKNRSDLQDRQMKDGDVSLVLKDVTINDTGTYVCRVLTERTGSLKPISIVYLSVSAGHTGGKEKDEDKKDGGKEDKEKEDGSVRLIVDPKIIRAVPGQNITLTCRAPNNNVTVLNWTRSDLKPEYVLLYQDGHFVSDDQHPSFKNRSDLRDKQMKDGDVSLILKDVTINDAGTYECRVFMNETGSWKNISFVYLVVPPGHKGGQEKDEDDKDGGKEDKEKEDGSVRLIVGLSVSAVLLVVVALLINLICRKYERGLSTIKQKERRKRKKTIERAVKYSKLNKAEPDVP